MKPLNIVVIVGSLAVAGLGAWYMYMQSSPQYQKSAQRGLDPALLPAAAAPSSAPAAPSSAPAAPSSAAAAPTEAPASAPVSGAAAPSSAPAAPSSATP